MNDRELSENWRTASLQYAKAINEYVARGRRDGWKAAGTTPEDNREQLAPLVIEAVRNANRNVPFRSVRADFPPAWEPFIGLLKENGQSLEPMQWLDNSRLALHVGPIYETGPVVSLSESEIVEQPGILNFGRSPCGTFCVWANEAGLEIRRGWGGPITARIPWGDTPSGEQGIKASQIIAFPDGQQVLLVGGFGVFVLSPSRVTRLLPVAAELVEPLTEDLSDVLSMPHGAVSSTGEFILAGSQDSYHLVFDDQLNQVAAIAPHSEYPHFAWFSTDGQLAAFNSCHFYNGISIGIRVDDLKHASTEFGESDSRIRVLEEGSRVYAAVARNDELIVGDANGYIRAFDLDGKFRWEHFIGSTINSLDLSPDKRLLAVTSYAGFCCVLELDSPEPDPFAIGSNAQRELWRWVFWKGEERPLRW